MYLDLLGVGNKIIQILKYISSRICTVAGLCCKLYHLHSFYVVLDKTDAATHVITAANARLQLTLYSICNRLIRNRYEKGKH